MGPATATGVLPMDEHGRIYANRECPYCGAPLEPLPAQRVACPSCGRTIHVETGPEGLTYLLRDADRSTFDAAWADYEDARHAIDPEVRRTAAERYLESVLGSYRAVGIEQVEIMSPQDPCPACAALLGRPYATGHAPLLPLPDCEHDVCRCDYVPVLA